MEEAKKISLKDFDQLVLIFEEYFDDDECISFGVVVDDDEECDEDFLESRAREFATSVKDKRFLMEQLAESGSNNTRAPAGSSGPFL